MRKFIVALALALLSALPVALPFLLANAPGGSPEGDMAAAWLTLGLWLLSGTVITAVAAITLLVSVFSQRNLRGVLATTQACFGSFVASSGLLFIGEPILGISAAIYAVLMLVAVARNASATPAK